MKRENLIGQKFGRLEVLSKADPYIYPNGKKRTRWLCRCDCGNIIKAEHTNLKSGNTKSCGCFHRDQIIASSTKHGDRKTRLYRIWSNMKNRCFNQADKTYKRYGGRGITVCSEWAESYELFKEWALSSGYHDDKDCSIDRIDTNGNYTPDNCRWSNPIEQANNRRNTLRYEYRGQIHTLSEWSKITGIKYHTLFARIKKLHWSIEDALTTA